MGLKKFFEERHKEAEAEKVYKREQHLAYQQGLQKGRLKGAYQAGFKQGKQEASRPPQSGLSRIFGGLEGASKTIGSLKPSAAQEAIWGLPGGRGQSMFDFGLPQQQRQKPHKKHRGKKITVYVK